MPNPRRRSRALLAALIGIGLAAGTGGAIGEWWLRRQEGPAPMRWGWRDPFAEHGRRPPAELNQLGYRGQKIEYGPDDLVVLLVGDSQVQADACPFAAMPERRLEAHLRAASGRHVRVFSVGALGYGTDQECLALDDYLARHRADIVVTWLTTGNDPREVLLPVAPVPKPTFWLEGDRLCGPLARIGDPVPHGLRLWQRLRDWWRGDFNEYWHRHVLPPVAAPLPVDEAQARTDWGWFDKSVRGPQAAQDFRREFLGVLAQIDPPSPRAVYATTLIQRLLQRMRAVTEAQGGVFRVLVDERSDATLPDGLYETTAGDQRLRLRLTRRAFDANLARMTADLDVARIPVTVETWAASADDPHLNAAAVDQVMHDLASELVRTMPKR
ncbi:MAG: hypothetical protein R3F56_14895 [Planctomycetota bacterium]